MAVLVAVLEEEVGGVVVGEDGSLVVDREAVVCDVVVEVDKGVVTTCSTLMPLTCGAQIRYWSSIDLLTSTHGLLSEEVYISKLDDPTLE